jgi:hypothetical protein
MDVKLTRPFIYKIIDGERDYQIRMSKKEERPDMVKELSVGDTLTAIRHNLSKAEAAWYGGSAPHEEAMGYLRKIAGLTVQAGENYGMPSRRSEQDKHLSACPHDTIVGCSIVTCNCK